MKYLKYFKTDVDCQNYFSSDKFVTPNVSYAEDADIVYFKPYTDDLIIMTSESNPEVMKVCYNQGWAASPYEMHASEAAKVKSIGTAFNGLGKGDSDGYGYNDYSSGNNYYSGNDYSSGYDSPSASFTFSFDEFKYFTGVTSIDAYAFYDSNIVSITIPDSVTSIGGSAFYGCDSLPVENGLRYADTYLVKASDTSLNTYAIKEGTKWIGDNAFNDCSNLTSIIIPDSVTYIGVSAFSGCTGLTSITIPDSVTYIGADAFCNCYGLTSITIPDSVTSIEERTFFGCTGLTSITIPDLVTSIRRSAFVDCAGLTSINIPDSVTSIEDFAFEDCTGLTSITIPDSVTSIGGSAFNRCTSLPIENSLRYADAFLVGAVDTTLSTYIIKEGTKWIGDNAFNDCSNLTSIIIPDSVTYIGVSAFSGCTGLTSITIPDSVTYIGVSAFSTCKGLTSIKIGNSVTYIGADAFCNCYGLTSITIPDSVTSIGERTFYGCSKLNEITCLATTAPSIGHQTFYYVKQSGILRAPAGSDYSSWMKTSSYYLGYYHWTTKEIQS